MCEILSVHACRILVEIQSRQCKLINKTPLIRSAKRASRLIRAHGTSYHSETVSYDILLVKNQSSSAASRNRLIDKLSSVYVVDESTNGNRPFRFFASRMDRSEIRLSKTFTYLRRNTPLFSSLEELHDKLTELLGKYFNITRHITSKCRLFSYNRNIS